MPLTQKNDFFEYVLPCQDLAGDTQAIEIQLGDTEYTAKKYIYGEAIREFGELEDVLEKYGIESAEELDKFIHHKDCQIEKWKQDYENCSKLEKSMSKEHQYCLDNWRACEQELAELKQKAIVLEKALEMACSHIPCEYCLNSNGRDVCYIAQDIGYYQPKQNCIVDNSYYFKLKAEKELKGE